MEEDAVDLRGGDDAGPLWLVINLDRSPDRLSARAAEFGALGIAFTRVPAVDGRAVPPSCPGVDPALHRATHGRAPLPGEVGCTFSHLRALRRFLATPHRHAVILEDDAAVTRTAVDVVSALVDAAAPDDWDLVKLEAHHSRFALTARRVAPGVRLCAMPYRAAGSAAYLVNRPAAEALLAGLLPMRYPYDVAFERGWDFGIRVRTVLPLPVVTAGSPSTIGRHALPEARRRAPALPRAWTKVLFAATALGAWAGTGRWRRPRAKAAEPGSFALAERALAHCGPTAEA